ncbi:hypothetical protein B0H19DRAFT_878386, partial [Mycena capillaripes]
RRCIRCLRRLSSRCSRLPPSYFLYDVKKCGEYCVTGGGFAVSYGQPVFKKMVSFTFDRIFGRANWVIQANQMVYLQDFCREALYLNHPNILPFFGVDDIVFQPSFCLISPWMENGNL